MAWIKVFLIPNYINIIISLRKKDSKLLKRQRKTIRAIGLQSIPVIISVAEILKLNEIFIQILSTI